jgi:hypothetical protein
MRSMFKVGILALTLAALPVAAQAGTLEGVAIVRHSRHRHCWTNDSGYRHCSWR